MADNRDDFIIAIRYALLKRGAKQKFSLFFLILLSVAILTLDKLSLPLIKPVRSTLNDVVYHVSVISSQPAKLKTFLAKKIKTHYYTMRDNEYLREEMEYLKQQKFNNAYLASENKILKDALNIYNKKEFEQNFSISAKVILDQKSPFLKSILINKGTRSGVDKGMTVFSKDFLMGIVTETNFLTSRVLLLTDLNSKLPVIIEGTDINAILEGTGKKLKLKLSYLPENYEIKADKTIFTSGKGGFLTPGIPLAKTYLDKKNNISIKLLGDPDQALIVYVTNGQVNQ
ncbi:rod shape-determining protein MreC [Pelagibacteraceae bacterium]|nr:rod shape-determining protein MreC [Pelagibacteraceae bacterium]